MPTKIPASAIAAGSVTADRFATGAVTAEKFAAGVGGGAAGLAIAAVAYANAGFSSNGQNSAATSGGYLIITGTGFESGATVMIGNIPATAVTFISSTELHVQIPAAAAGNYLLQISNPNGRWALKSNGVTYS